MSVNGLWFGHDVNLKCKLKISIARQVSRGLSAMVILAKSFLHLNQNTVHRRWAPSFLSTGFGVSPRQLVSSVYLLPFQLDRDNREAYLDRGLCHLKSTVAIAEVMPCKGNEALLFPPSTQKHM